MPNWCNNRVDIYIEDEKNVQEFLDYIKGTLDDEGEVEIPFSFASIMPEPDYKTTPVATHGMTGDFKIGVLNGI